MQLAIFPQPVFLLPGGKTRIKVIEPRYLRLVSKVVSGNLSFVLSLKTAFSGSFNIATRVSIYDFDKTKEGFLLIDIEAQEQVLLSHFYTDKDGLFYAQVVPFINHCLPHLRKINRKQFAVVSQMLKSLLIFHPLYQHNIDQLPLKNMTWVCRRWLELLPLDINDKYWLANSHNIIDNLSFVNQLIVLK